MFSNHFNLYLCKTWNTDIFDITLIVSINNKGGIGTINSSPYSFQKNSVFKTEIFNFFFIVSVYSVILTRLIKNILKTKRLQGFVRCSTY